MGFYVFVWRGESVVTCSGLISLSCSNISKKIMKKKNNMLHRYNLLGASSRPRYITTTGREAPFILCASLRVSCESQLSTATWVRGLCEVDCIDSSSYLGHFSSIFPHCYIYVWLSLTPYALLRIVSSHCRQYFRLLQMHSPSRSGEFF